MDQKSFEEAAAPETVVELKNPATPETVAELENPAISKTVAKPICIIYDNPTSNEHKCQICNSPCFVICGVYDKEVYGKSVTCNLCSRSQNI